MNYEEKFYGTEQTEGWLFLNSHKMGKYQASM